MEQDSGSLIGRDIGDQFYVLKELGHGTYGQVLLAKDRVSGQSVALKVQRKNRTLQRSFFHELSISVDLSDFPGIITTYNAYLETADHYISIQELAPAGSLQSIIEPEVGVPEELVKRCAVQLTQALEYIHSRGLVHRDLKPDNVLLMDRECHHIKLTDFGFTQHVGTLVPSMSPFIPYMSLELCALRLNECLILDTSVDIWAFGVLLFVIITGYSPWQEAVESDQYFQMFVQWQRNGRHGSPPLHWTKLTKEALDMFSKLLCLDPRLRCPAGEVLEYLQFPWSPVEVFMDSMVVFEEQVIETTSTRENEAVELITIHEQGEVVIVEGLRDIDLIFLNSTEAESLIHEDMLMLLAENALSVAVEVEIT